MCVRAGEQHGVHTADIRREARRVQRADEGLGRHQHLAAEMAALLFRGQLILEMDARGASLDHCLHQFEGVEGATEAGFRIRDDRCHVMGGLVALHMGDLVRAAQGVVDAAHHIRHRGGRIERLVRIHLAGIVGVRRHLPTREIDRLQTSLDLLHRLVAGQRAERADEGTVGKQMAQAGRAHAGQRVFHLERATQLLHIGGSVIPLVLRGVGGGHRKHPFAGGESRIRTLTTFDASTTFDLQAFTWSSCRTGAPAAQQDAEMRLETQKILDSMTIVIL